MRQNLLDPAMLERFLAARTRRDEASGCVVWQRSVTSGQYARVAAPWGGTIAVHRLAYLVFVGPLRGDLEIHHTCANRRCCNPEHLRPVTDLDHKRADVNWVGNRTHCIRGHPLSGDNLSPGLLKRGIRRCKICSALRQRELRAADPEVTRRKGRERMREWREANREHWNEYQRTRRRKQASKKTAN